MSSYSKIQATPQQRAARAPEFASILIVDDQRFDRTRLNRLCRALEFTTNVVEADTLAAMGDRLSKDRFDLILLDYHLPDGTGLQGVDMIRADPVNHGAATIMITGTEEQDIALQALKLGFTDYLSKDELSPESLRRASINAIQKSQLANGMADEGAQRLKLNETLQSFSRECAQDIKPIVSRMMRQMRAMRDIDKLSPEEAVKSVERVEGSLRRLWAFLDDLDQLGNAADTEVAGPTVPPVRGSLAHPFKGINARVPSERPTRKPVKPPSIFRRRPD